MISRVLGFLRDVVFAHVFGAGAATDAFFVAFKIPNFLRRLFAEGAFATAFVPVLAEYQTKRSFEALQALVARVAGTLGAVLLLVTVLGVAGAPALIAVFAPGWYFDADPRYELATEMLRLTFPYLLFISLTAFAGGILNAHHRFGVPAFTPVLLNLSLIACAIWLAPKLEIPIVALAWGVLIAGVSQFVFQLPFLYRLKMLRIPEVKPSDEGVRKIGRLMLPALFGVSVTQLNLLLDVLIASFLTAGSISWLYYSDRLVEFPLGVLGVALGTVILPSLSRRHASEDMTSFSATMDWALRWVWLFGVPASLGLLALAGPMIATLFYSEAFDARSVTFSSYSLMAYSVGLVPFMLIKVLAPGYFARQDTKTPVRIAVIAMLSNMVLNIILVFPLAHSGLALATSLSALLNATLLFRGLRRDGVYLKSETWPFLMPRVLFSGAAMLVLLYLLTPDLDAWLMMGAWSRVVNLVMWIGFGAGVYFAILWVGGVRFRHFRASSASTA